MRHHDSSVAGINQVAKQPGRSRMSILRKKIGIKAMYCKFLWPENVGSQLVQLYSQIK